MTKEIIEPPAAGEFTKKIRGFVKLYENEIPRRAEITFLAKACDIIDTLEASRKELQIACQQFIDDGRAHSSVIEQGITAIANAWKARI